MVNLKSFSDFIKYNIIPKVTCVSYRDHFKGWNAMRTMLEHQLILILEGSGHILINGQKYFAQVGDLIYLPPQTNYGLLKPENCSAIQLILVQFSYILVENHEVTWIWDAAKNFSVMKNPDLQWHIHIDCPSLPLSPVEKVTNYHKIKSLFLEMYNIKHASPIDYKWHEQFILSQLLYETAKNHFFYEKKQNHVHLINWVIKYFSEHYQENISLDDIINSVNISKSHFIRIFREYTNHTPMDYLNHFRIERAKELLCQTELSIKNISIDVGFSDEFYFSRLFKKRVGVSPQHYRKYQHSLTLFNPDTPLE